MSSPLSGTAGHAVLEATPHRRGQLALALQEAMTATVRLRTEQQMAADADAFRTHIKRLMSSAHEIARRAGYSSEDVKLAIYAFTAFLDESVLNSPQPMFAEWHSQPLQEEIFGGHMGGEIFFENLTNLFERGDTDDAADVLEIYQLCLLLGFQGRYSHDPNQLRGLISDVETKIQRIRGNTGELSPSWAPPPGDAVPASMDRWIPRLARFAIFTGALALLLFALFHLLLKSSGNELRLLGTAAGNALGG